MNEHDLQWLIVQLRVSLAYMLSDSTNKLTRKDAEKLLDRDASRSIDYPFNYDRTKELDAEWSAPNPQDKPG